MDAISKYYSEPVRNTLERYDLGPESGEPDKAEQPYLRRPDSNPGILFRKCQENDCKTPHRSYWIRRHQHVGIASSQSEFGCQLRL